MTKQPSKKKPMTALDNALIIIIGPRSLQNGLMGHFLEEKTGAKCLAISGPSQLPAKEGEEGDEKRLILGDCLEKDLEGCMADLESYGEAVLSKDYVVLFNVSPGLKIEENALRRGVKGFFYEQNPLEVLPRGLGAILKGEIWVSRDIMTKFIPDDKGPDPSRMEASILTPREIEILSLVAIGAKNEEIAERLYISSNTVKTHIYNIFKKIDVPNRLQAALWAAKNL